MTHSKIIEVMRDGITSVYGCVISPDGLNMIAEIALSALHAEGLAVVPVVPSEKMLAAGDSGIPRAELDERGLRMMGREVALAAWQAMLAATNSTKEESDE